MLIGILALGTIGFWVFLGLFTILFWCLLEVEKPGWATFSMALGLVALGYLGNFSVVGLAKTNPLAFVGLIAGYFAVGALWSVIKWWFHVTKMARKYKELKSDWMAGVNRTNPGTFIPGQAFTAEQKDRFHRGSNAATYATRPKAKKNKGKILTWMIYWPWSFTWTMINDPVVRLFKEIFIRMSKLFDKISARAYRGIDED